MSTKKDISKKQVIEYFGDGIPAHAAKELGVSRSHVFNWHDKIVWGSVTHKMIVGYLVLHKKFMPEFLK